MKENTSHKKPITGLHILGEFHTNNTFFLKDLLSVKDKIIESVNNAGLHQVGIAEHSFPGAGFTFVVLLAESHLSIHTWPELQYVTIDVFACNVSRDNSDIARILFDVVINLFEPINVIKREIMR